MNPIDLNSSIIRNNWFVACKSKELKRQPISRTVLGTPIVLVRFNGKAFAFIDRCPHRNAPMSAGRVIGETLQCPYHGWTFGPDGRCENIPGLVCDGHRKNA